MVAHAEGGRSEALIARRPHLYALANALDANAATDGPDAGAWVDPPAGGAARVLGPADDLVTTEAYGVVDPALAELDPINVGLVTLVDIEGAPFSEPSSSSTCPPARRARFAPSPVSRSAPRATGASRPPVCGRSRRRWYVRS
jgi:hypothetical protein